MKSLSQLSIGMRLTLWYLAIFLLALYERLILEGMPRSFV